MKKFITLAFLTLTFNTFAQETKCDSFSFDGNYETRYSFVEEEYTPGINFQDIIPNYDISMYTFSLKKNEDGAFKFTYGGLTEEGEKMMEVLVLMDGEFAKTEFLELQKNLETLSFHPILINGQCSLSADGKVLASVDETSQALYNISEENGKKEISEIMRKIEDIVVDEDPFDF